MQKNCQERQSVKRQLPELNIAKFVLNNNLGEKSGQKNNWQNLPKLDPLQHFEKMMICRTCKKMFVRILELLVEKMLSVQNDNLTEEISTSQYCSLLCN